MQVIRHAAISGLALALFAGSANAASLYTLVDLGDLAGGSDSSAALSINDAGTVVGWGRSAAGQRAVMWKDGQILDLGFTGTSIANAINASGTVAGSFGSAGFSLPAGGSSTSIGDLPGGAVFSTATAVNGQGVVVGYSTGSAGTGATSRAVMWKDGVLTDLGSLNDGAASGGFASYANDINAAGTIVGYSSASGGQHAFVWQNGVMSDLGVLDGTTTSRANAINASGTIVGASGSFAAIWQDGQISQIASVAGATGAATAYDINDAGWVVGQVRVEGGNQAFLWRADSGMVLLSTLLGEEYAGWTVTDARSINNQGWIAATASFNGVSHAVLLQAVPEPESWALLVAGIAVIGAFARRRLPA
ncbi:PEP-CTERM sorting domain-containing protein [Methyloversatilis thermotolerans]|uniref:PEP-CTERM sorting domain-containing protein n=1 Tax=Methyloversatilis thermotolerans TaxID=1346290 RepID=UPI0003754AC6|nr:PEP-CTERM sorting domain-containing protein [Methyloversatilis thermotolerans]